MRIWTSSAGAIEGGGSTGYAGYAASTAARETVKGSCYFGWPAITFSISYIISLAWVRKSGLLSA